MSPCHVSTLEKKICGRWIIKNNENPPNDIEQPITEEVCIQEENMKIYNDNKSAETATTTYSPIYQQEEIEKLLKLADEDCDDLYDLDNTAINNTDENEMEDERDQEPCLYPSLRDHETGSDHDMNYEICNQKKAEQCISKQILPHREENILGHYSSSTINKNETNGTIKLTNNDDDNNPASKLAANRQAQRPVPAPRNLFLRPETRLKIKLDSNSEISVRERAKTFSFVETCQIPPTPFRYHKLPKAGTNINNLLLEVAPCHHLNHKSQYQLPGNFKVSPTLTS